MNYDTVNELIVAALDALRYQLFEPSDYSIIELCDIMIGLNSREDLFDGDPDVITSAEATEFALIVGLQTIRSMIEKLAPGHFEGAAFRSEVARLAED